jgi:hypothetical protein
MRRNRLSPMVRVGQRQRGRDHTIDEAGYAASLREHIVANE